MKLHSLYRCRLVRLTPYAIIPAIDGSVLTVAVRECIVVFGSISARSILGVYAPSVVSLKLNGRVYSVCEQILVALSCDAMTDVDLQTVHNVLRIKHT